MLDVMRYRVNLDALSLKESDKNEKSESDSAVAEDDAASDEKTS